MQAPSTKPRSKAPHSGRPAPLSVPPADARSRLLLGMREALSEKGYAESTILDVVRHARVSKRTFYEHFADKEACFLATYEGISADLLQRIAEVAGEIPLGEDQLEATTRAYFSFLEEHQALGRAFLTEIHAAGPDARKVRRKVMQRFADLLRALVEQGRIDNPLVESLSPDLAIAIVGGINELLLTTIEEGRMDRLGALRESAVALIRAVIAAPQVAAAAAATLPAQKAAAKRKAR